MTVWYNSVVICSAPSLSCSDGKVVATSFCRMVTAWSTEYTIAGAKFRVPINAQVCVIYAQKMKRTHSFLPKCVLGTQKKQVQTS